MHAYTVRDIFMAMSHLALGGMKRLTKVASQKNSAKETRIHTMLIACVCASLEVHSPRVEMRFLLKPTDAKTNCPTPFS